MENTVAASTLRGLYEVFWAPGALMERLRVRPHWVVPLVVVGLLTVVLALAMQPYSAKAALSMIPDSATPEQAAQMRERMQGGGVVGPLIAPVTIVLKTLLSAALLLGLATMLAGGGQFNLNPAVGTEQPKPKWLLS
jgi:peptidoglycan/LPS O-acetylase OafA/YrhL